MANKTGNIFKYSISFILAGALVYFAFRGVDWRAFLDGLKQTRWIWMIPYYVAFSAALFFRERRWRSILKPLGGELSHRKIWNAQNVGNVVNIVLPGAGELARCGYVSDKRRGFDRTFGTVMCERILDVFFIVLLFILSLSCGGGKYSAFFREQIAVPVVNELGGSFWLYGIILSVALLSLIVVVYCLRKNSRICGRIAGAVSGIGAGLTSFMKMDGKALFFLYSALIWLMYVITSLMIAIALPATSSLSFTDILFITAVANIASVIPVPGGIGAYHYLVALCIESLFMLSWDAGILYATLNHEAHAVLLIVVGLISYVDMTLNKKSEINRK